MAGPTPTYTPSNNSGYNSPSAMGGGAPATPASPVITQPNLVVRGAPAGYDVAPGSGASGSFTYGVNAPSNVNPVITPDALTPTAKIPLPGTPANTNYNGALLGGNTALGLLGNNNTKIDTAPVTDPKTGQVSTLDTILKQNSDLFNSYINSEQAPPNLTDEYTKLEADQGIQQKQQIVNDLTAQINSISAGATADKLALTGTGRGVPEVIIGGQQAQIDKEAAIRAIPLQASLAAAQGNLQFAQDRLETLFKLRSTDVTNQYNYKKGVRDAVYGFLSDQQKTKVAAFQKADDREYDAKKTNLSTMNSWIEKVVETGQPQLIAQFGKLDPESPTFQKDLATITAKVRIPVKATAVTELTADEKKSAALSQFSSAFVQGAKLKDGTPVLDSNSRITPVAWKQAIADAPSLGLSRNDFITQFGNLLYIDPKAKSISAAYGLTPAEQKIVNGVLPE